ncbi:MAG: hypothetical protein AAFQ07_03485 [Chloroflexota bacterium]
MSQRNKSSRKSRLLSWFYVSVFIIGFSVLLTGANYFAGEISANEVVTAFWQLALSMIILLGIPYVLYKLMEGFNKWIRAYLQGGTGISLRASNSDGKWIGLDSRRVKYHIARLGDTQDIFEGDKTDTEMLVWGDAVLDGKFITIGEIAFERDDVQWVGNRKSSDRFVLDVTINGWWHVLTVFTHESGKDFANTFLEHMPKKYQFMRYRHRPHVRSTEGATAFVTEQNLQGIFEDKEAVFLHITPLWLVVLHAGQVFQQHFLDTVRDVRYSKHPTSLDDEAQLLTFEVGDTAFAYSMKDDEFVQRLIDATRESVSTEEMRKKKKQSS